MNDDDINEKYTTVHGLWKDVTGKERFIIASFDHFAQVTKKLDLLLPQRFPFQKDAQKPFLFGTWSRRGFSPGAKISP